MPFAWILELGQVCRESGGEEGERVDGQEGKRVDAQHQGRREGLRGKEPERNLLLYK